jgi:hypothetical protein
MEATGSGSNLKVMDSHFASIFQKIGAPTARGKYLSRVFGIFSEEIVRAWASHPQSPYEDLGRPTIRRRNERAGSTLDFTLRHKHTGKTYVAEMKCEIEYQNFKYLVLSSTKQLDHHNKAAFVALLDAAARNADQQVFVNGRELPIDGAILIWGSATPDGRLSVMQAKGFSEVLTIAEIIEDLGLWQCANFRQLVEQRQAWTNEMFDAFVEHTKVGLR